MQPVDWDTAAQNRKPEAHDRATRAQAAGLTRRVPAVLGDFQDPVRTGRPDICATSYAVPQEWRFWYRQPDPS
ncbi:hypothetical protein ACFYO2_21305 [Streptomyces sp. NPDC006602]|uniref:hypothetical protein n=1 Tax=Streptomyces sp. NPDC006602 TaxID=3364751 RepID=UPI0036C22E6F